MAAADVSWMEQAACAGVAFDVFFPPARGGSDICAEAKALCEPCPVRVACLDYALAERIRFGVWGGLATPERDRIRRRRSRSAA